MSVLLVEARTRVPLTLTIDREGVGGISGLVPTVAIRRGSTAGSYLDWGDNSFKTSGWTQKYATLTESERGTYDRNLDLAVVPGAPAGTVLIAEYHVDDGGEVQGDDHDVVVIVSTQTDLDFVRKLGGSIGAPSLVGEVASGAEARGEVRDQLGVVEGAVDGPGFAGGADGPTVAGRVVARCFKPA
jgi:hypothetical protein